MVRVIVREKQMCNVFWQAAGTQQIVHHAATAVKQNSIFASL
jgi:hypothetical protein